MGIASSASNKVTSTTRRHSIGGQTRRWHNQIRWHHYVTEIRRKFPAPHGYPVNIVYGKRIRKGEFDAFTLKARQFCDGTEIRHDCSVRRRFSAASNPEEGIGTAAVVAQIRYDHLPCVDNANRIRAQCVLKRGQTRELNGSGYGEAPRVPVDVAKADLLWNVGGSYVQYI